MLSTHKSIQLKGAVEASYFAFQQARSAAIGASADVTVSITSGTQWCVGISDVGDCDCNTLNSCTLNGVEQLVSARDYNYISMKELSFGDPSRAVFDGVRGLSIGSAGSTVFDDGENEAKLILSNMGRVRICVDEGALGTYSSC